MTHKMNILTQGCWGVVELLYDILIALAYLVLLPIVLIGLGYRKIKGTTDLPGFMKTEKVKKE